MLLSSPFCASSFFLHPFFPFSSSSLSSPITTFPYTHSLSYLSLIPFLILPSLITLLLQTTLPTQHNSLHHVRRRRIQPGTHTIPYSLQQQTMQTASTKTTTALIINNNSDSKNSSSAALATVKNCVCHLSLFTITPTIAKKQHWHIKRPNRQARGPTYPSLLSHTHTVSSCAPPFYDSLSSRAMSVSTLSPPRLRRSFSSAASSSTSWSLVCTLFSSYKRRQNSQPSGNQRKPTTREGRHALFAQYTNRSVRLFISFILAFVNRSIWIGQEYPHQHHLCLTPYRLQGTHPARRAHPSDCWDPLLHRE